MADYNKKDLSEKLFIVFSIFVMGALLVLSIYPFYYILIISISDSSRALGNVFLVPAGFSLSAYSNLLMQENIFSALTISILRTLVGTIVTLICCSFFAYLMTKKFILRKVIYRMLVFTMYFNAGLIPWYMTMKAYRLTDTFILYIIPYAVSAFYVILLKTFIEQMPAAIEESALLDGAGVFTIFYKVIIPLSKPILATIAVFAAVNHWNIWIDNYFLVHSQKLQTLQLVLYTILNEAESIARKMQDSSGGISASRLRISPLTLRMAITMITTIPIILVYPFLQKYFIKGIMLGAIKG